LGEFIAARNFVPLDEVGFLAALRMENEKMEWENERAGKEEMWKRCGK